MGGDYTEQPKTFLPSHGQPKWPGNRTFLAPQCGWGVRGSCRAGVN